MTTSEIIQHLEPVLLWLHSKKRDAAQGEEQWAKAWEAMAMVCFPYLDNRLHYLEQAVLDAQGVLVAATCDCVHCKPTVMR